MSKNIGDLICGSARHEAIKADPRKIQALTLPAMPQVVPPDRVLEQRRCTACGTTLVIKEIVVGDADGRRARTLSQ